MLTPQNEFQQMILQTPVLIFLLSAKYIKLGHLGAVISAILAESILIVAMMTSSNGDIFRVTGLC